MNTSKKEQLESDMLNALIGKDLSEDALKNMTNNVIKKAQQIREAEKRREEKAKEARRKWKIEQMKPEVFVPNEAQSMHVEANRIQFEEKCQKCDFKTLVNYTQEIKLGRHRNDFRGKDVTGVILFLEGQIQKRKPKETSEKEVEELRKTRAAAEVVTNQIVQLQRDTCELKAHLNEATESESNKKPSVEYSR